MPIAILFFGPLADAVSISLILLVTGVLLAVVGFWYEFANKRFEFAFRATQDRPGVSSFDEHRACLLVILVFAGKDYSKEGWIRMLSRRNFLKLVAKGAILGNFINLITPYLEEAVAQGEVRKLPVLMVETGTCTGDSISLQNSWTPTLSDILMNITEWRYDWTLMQAQGDLATQVLTETYANFPHEYVLIVQGSMIHRDQGHYNHISLENGNLLTGIELVRRLGLKAKYVVAIGSCAAFGGPVKGYPNPTNCTGVQEVLPERKVINVSGCPAHPDWIMGTLLHLALYGLPELDNFGRPKMFYGETIHDRCPRRSNYDQGIFATDWGQKECLYRVGCKGPVTYADCPIRRWNDRFNWPVGCNTPCIGCTEPGYPDLMEPFASHLPDIPLPTGTRVAVNKVALGVAGLTGAAIAGHFALSLYNGRLQKNLLQTTFQKKKHPQLKRHLKKEDAKKAAAVKATAKTQDTQTESGNRRQSAVRRYRLKKDRSQR